MDLRLTVWKASEAQTCLFQAELCSNVMAYWPVSIRWKQSGSIQLHAHGPLLYFSLSRSSQAVMNSSSVLIRHLFCFLSSLSVHNLEFCPKEPVRAIQKDSQLLFPHYFSCSGNKTQTVLVCWCVLSSVQLSWVTCLEFSCPKYKCMCVHRTWWLIAHRGTGLPVY